MDELNVGVIPVCEGDKLVGMVTDRDIVVRGVAQEADTTSMRLADVMSANVRCATEDEDVDEVLDEMARNQIRRMPVVDSKEHLVGIITLGDIAAKTRRRDGCGPIAGRDLRAGLAGPLQPVQGQRRRRRRLIGQTPKAASLTANLQRSCCLASTE